MWGAEMPDLLQEPDPDSSAPEEEEPGGTPPTGAHFVSEPSPSLVPATSGLASVAASSHASDVAISVTPALQSVQSQQSVQPMADLIVESAIRATVISPEVEGAAAHRLDAAPAESMLQPVKDSVVHFVVKPSGTLTVRAAGVPALNAAMALGSAVSADMSLADAAPASPATPSSAGVAAPSTPGWAIEARRAPGTELTGTPFEVSFPTDCTVF